MYWFKNRYLFFYTGLADVEMRWAVRESVTHLFLSLSLSKFTGLSEIDSVIKYTEILSKWQHNKHSPFSLHLQALLKELLSERQKQ